MKKILVLFVFMFMTILSGCNLKKEEIDHKGKYYLKEFYVDVLGTSDGHEYVDYTLRYTKSSCINYDGEAFEDFCDLLLLGDEFYFEVTDSMLYSYMDGEKKGEEEYVLREDLAFYVKSEDEENVVYEKGYFFEDGLVYEGDSERYDIYMIFTKE